MNIPDDIEPIIRQLCTLLRVEFKSEYVTATNEETLERWKLLSQDLAHAHSENAEKVIRLWSNLGLLLNEPSTCGLCHWIAANMLYFVGNPVEAHKSFILAESCFTKSNDVLSTARMSVGWVHVLSEIGEYREAESVFSKSIPVLASSKEPDDKVRCAGMYGNAGIVYESLGQFSEALSCYQYKLEFYQNRNNSIENSLELSMSFNSIGVAQLLLGQYHDARETFQQAILILDEYETDKRVWVDKTFILINQAWLETLRSKSIENIKSVFQKARVHRTKLGPETPFAYFSLLDLHEANWLIYTDQWQAVDVLQIKQLENLTNEVGFAYEQAYAQLILGQIELYEGHHAQALDYFDSIAREFATQNPAINYLTSVWQARTLQKTGRTNDAKRILNDAIKLVEQTRKTLTTDDYRAGYLEDKLIGYQVLSRLHWESGEVEDAFRISEQAKARTLTDALEFQTPNDQSLGTTTKPSEQSIKHIAQQLPLNTVAISYSNLDDCVLVYLIDNNGLVTAPLKLLPKLERSELQNGLRKIHNTRRNSERMINGAQDILGTWYENYISPLWLWIEAYEHVVISPDGLLNALPFCCLYDPERKSYFVETHSIIVTPSLSTWWLNTSKAQNRLLTTASHFPRALIFGNSSINGTSGQLPRTIDEAYEVASLFNNPDLYIENEATTQNFVNNAPSADFIYIAAHGEYQTGAAVSSFLELADQNLHTPTIFSLTLNASTAVLSACETSKGYLTGNEMMGLVRAFLYAGVESVVAANWSIDDDATYLLMTSFVKKMCTGSSASEALRDAQLTFIRNDDQKWSRPSFWGALSVIGSDSLLVAHSE